MPNAFADLPPFTPAELRSMRGRLGLIIGAAKARAYFRRHFPLPATATLTPAAAPALVVAVAAPKPRRVSRRIPPALFTQSRPDRKKKR